MEPGRSVGGSSSKTGPEPCSVHSSRGHPAGRAFTNSNPRVRNSPAAGRQRQQQQQHPQSKFDVYLPLCEVQQGLKRGELIEGILRVNPRNYEDSYISAPDGLMDIYIKGVCDRNRALNGDLVAVRLRPPKDWKILWDVIKDFEERHGTSVFASNSNPCTDPDAAETVTAWGAPSTADVTLPDGGEAGQGWASGWLSSDRQRPADTLDVLGLDQLQLQYQEFTQKNKTKKPRNRSKKNRLLLQKQQDPQTLTPDSPTPSSTSACQPNSHSTPLAPHSSIDPLPLGSQDLVDRAVSNSLPLEADTQAAKRSSLNMKTSNSDLASDVNSTSPLSSPVDCQSNTCKINDVEDVAGLSSEEELFPKSSAVAPDELSGDEFSNSVSGDSMTCQQLVQDLEDEEFFAEHQDACNNNETVENFPVDLILDEPLDPATEIQNLIRQTQQLHVTQVPEPEKTAVGPGGNESVGADSKPSEEGRTPAKDAPQFPTGDKSSSQNGNGNEETSSGKAKRKHRNRRHNRKPKEDRDQQREAAQTPKPSDPATKRPLPKPAPSRRNAERKGSSHPDVTVEQILQLPHHHRFIQKTAKVVYIIERKHSRAAMGHLKKQQDNNPYWAIFSPTDHRMPRMLIPMIECPKDFYERPEDFKSSLFIAMIKEWDERSAFARGSLARSLGEAGEIEPETEGILIENDIIFSEFSEECLKDLPAVPWQIPQEEVEKRRDFRDQCVFTIDPKTARDLDDAVSVRQVEEELLEIGVHIADVSFFLKENSALDAEASRRSTSVYLVQKVVPMLPRVLCENLCSLNPGEDKLTFSVVWKMTPEGEIVDEWFGRSVIHSCTKFSYEHAQDMIENGERDWKPDELPEFHGKFGPRDVLWCVQTLQELAVKLRQRRFHQGALKLDQIKIQFSLNNETGMPSGFSIYEQKDSNRLIEEFMLLANMAVAHKIYKAFPGLAFLRCHPPPQAKMMNDLVESCATLGIHLDHSTAGNLQASLARYSGDDVLSMARSLVLTHLCSKPMKPARYFCAGWTSDREDFHHYALNVPLYTHFTSPIRRYPDVIVHRLLAAALSIGCEPKQSAVSLQRLGAHCNDRKLTAKRVHEMSCELFLGCFIREVGPLEEPAVVVDVMDHSFDVLIYRMGVIKRVYCDKLSVSKMSYEKQMGVSRLTLTWPGIGQPIVQQIVIFTLVQVVISSIPKETMRFNVIIKPPKVQQSNEVL